MTPTDLFRRTTFAGPMSALPLACLDVGSRGGIEPDLLPAAFAVDAVGFEPDRVECDRLNSAADGPWRSVRFVPTALAGHSGTRTLHVARDPVSSSLLPPISASGQRFNQVAYSTIVDKIDLDAIGLDEAVDRFGLAAPDYVKLDTEGLELEILGGAERALKTVSAVKTEVAFMEFREGQPAARAVDEFLSQRGFELMSLLSPAYWRRHGHVLHPHLGTAPVPYSRGQLAQGDFLYMRHPDAFAPAETGETAATEQRLKAAWIAMIHGYFDRAEEYLADPDVVQLLHGRWRLDAAAALRQASQVYGRSVWRRAFQQQIRGLIPFLKSTRPALFRRP